MRSLAERAGLIQAREFNSEFPHGWADGRPVRGTTRLISREPGKNQEADGGARPGGSSLSVVLKKETVTGEDDWMHSFGTAAKISAVGTSTWPCARAVIAQ